MKPLDELKKQQPQILLAELAGLLHNIGKLHGDFFGKFTGGRKYNDQRADEALVIVKFKAAKSLIEDTSKSRRDLITALLGDGSLWNSDTSVAQNLANEWRKITRTSQQFKEIGKDLRAAAASVASPQTNVVIEAALGAYKLADLMQVGGIDQHLDQTVKDWLRKNCLNVLSEKHSLSEILLLYWDDFHTQPNTPNDQMRISRVDRWIDHATVLPRYLATAHGIVSGADKDELGEGFKPQKSTTPFRSSVFGHEVHNVTSPILDAVRQKFLDLLMSDDLSKSGWRQALADSIDEHLNLALGDMRWPINDVTLWEFASSIAAFFKAAVAKAVLENRFVETSDLQWRLLSIRYDGLEYLSRAHHISDLLARRDALESALDAVKAVIEVEYPMGNEIYRDENGSVLLVPHVQDGDQTIELLAQECGENDRRGTFESLLLNRFSEARYDKAQKREPLDGEVHPIIALSDEFLGKQINLTKAKGWQNPMLQPDPVKVKEWWSDKKKQGEICTVCGLRPQGYGASDDRDSKTDKKGWMLHLEEKHHLKKQPRDCEVCKAIDRQVCWVCMERRDDRSKKWATNDDGSLKRTIWTDEVADDNGRLALVVGRFVLDCWLDGTLIPTMQKSASFARIQRCWRTTQGFWQEMEKGGDGLLKLVGCNRERRIITAEKFDPDEFGSYHVYDLEWNGRRLSVVWDKEKQSFITADNLEYFKKTAGDIEHLKRETVSILEPSAHLSRSERKTRLTISDISVHPESYSPFIPIMAQPSLFMALVPADKALEVVRKIKCKYEEEMGKVRDRLPLHVGVVFAPRRTPVRALLEAGRKMLEMPDCWEQWKIKSNTLDKYHNLIFENGVAWKIRAVMGDDATRDQWYPHMMLRRPVCGENLNDTKPWKHTTELKGGDEVYVRPSRFDFEFLDTAGRRFEISYGGDGRRRGLVCRPFLLEDVEQMDTLWRLLAKREKNSKRQPLTTSHLQHLESTLTSYITEWFNGDVTRAARCETYRKFAKDVLRRLDAGWWKHLEKQEKELLDNAVTSGLILDLLELRMHILKEKSQADRKGENS